jgi:uncharacterized membrane protein
MSDDTTHGIEEQRVRALERVVSLVLRLGVLTSFVLVVAGTLMTFLQAPSPDAPPANANGTILTAAPALSDLPRDLARFNGPAWIALGLLVLILTPVMRVAVSAVGFALQKDRVYVGITLTVLAVLIASFLMGQAGG